MNAGYTLEPRSGIVLLIWDDGLLLFAEDPDEPGRELRVARVPTGEVRRLVEYCVDLGFFELPDWVDVAMHASSESLQVRAGGRKRTFTWDRSVFPSSHWYPDVSGETYRRVWQRVEFAMTGLVPASSIPQRELVPDGKLRGFRENTR